MHRKSCLIPITINNFPWNRFLCKTLDNYKHNMLLCYHTHLPLFLGKPLEAEAEGGRGNPVELTFSDPKGLSILVDPWILFRTMSL